MGNPFASSDGEEVIGVGGRDEYVKGLLFGRGVGKIPWNVGGSSTSTAPVGGMESSESCCCNTDGVVLMTNGLDCFLNSTVESCSGEESTASCSFVFDATESGDSYPLERALRGSAKRS